MLKVTSLSSWVWALARASACGGPLRGLGRPPEREEEQSGVEADQGCGRPGRAPHAQRQSCGERYAARREDVGAEVVEESAGDERGQQSRCGCSRAGQERSPDENARDLDYRGRVNAAETGRKVNTEDGGKVSADHRLRRPLLTKHALEICAGRGQMRTERGASPSPRRPRAIHKGGTSPKRSRGRWRGDGVRGSKGLRPINGFFQEPQELRARADGLSLLAAPRPNPLPVRAEVARRGEGMQTAPLRRRTTHRPSFV